MDFTCPTCDVLLKAQKLEKLRLLACPSCRGFAISLPLVRKGLDPKTFKKIWQRLTSGEIAKGRSCPGCKNPLSEVKADGQDGAVMIEVCRSCQIFWFDDQEFSKLPKAVPEVKQEEQSESRVLTETELAFRMFKEDQNRRRSFLLKLLDGSVSKELGLKNLFGDLFNK